MAEAGHEGLPAELGEVIAGYRLERILGHGGMGCVYAATHVRLGRKAAVKVLASALAADAGYVSRFLHEAKVANAVRHPNIIEIYEFVEADDPRRVANVMELIEGPSLASVLEQTSLSLVQVLGVALQIVDAVEAVHEVGVVHRDLKPDNVMLLEPFPSEPSVVPRVKILDFGIAKVKEPGVDHRTRTGFMLGTPAYMTPEQIGSEPITPATDVYGIGELLYEMITRQRMYRGDARAVFAAKLLGKVPELVAPEGMPCAAELRSLVNAAVAADPQDRPPLAEVRDALIAIRARVPGHGELRPVRDRLPSVGTEFGARALGLDPETFKELSSPRVPALGAATEISMTSTAIRRSKRSRAAVWIGGFGALGVVVAIGLYAQGHLGPEPADPAAAPSTAPARSTAPAPPPVAAPAAPSSPRIAAEDAAAAQPAATATTTPDPAAPSIATTDAPSEAAAKPVIEPAAASSKKPTKRASPSGTKTRGKTRPLKREDLAPW